MRKNKIFFQQDSNKPAEVTMPFSVKICVTASWFYHNLLAYNPAAITPDDINEFASHYSAPGTLDRKVYLEQCVLTRPEY
jgi:hypothetical protein